VVRNPFGPWLNSSKNKVVWRKVYFISDISYVSYNIRLTMMGQLATFLYSRLAHKEATGNSAYFFEYKPHLTYSFKVACPSKEQVHEERVEVVIFRPNIWTKTSSKHLDNSFHIPPLFWDAKHKGALTIELNRLVLQKEKYRKQLVHTWKDGS